MHKLLIIFLDAMLCREAPISVTHGLGHEDHDQEGRVVTAEFPHFFLTNVYTPNSGAHKLRKRVSLDRLAKTSSKFPHSFSTNVCTPYGGARDEYERIVSGKRSSKFPHSYLMKCAQRPTAVRATR